MTLVQLRAAVTRRRASYFGIAVLAFMVATLAADVRAQVVLSGTPPAAAVRDHLYWAVVQLPGTIISFTPFAVVAWWASRNDTQRRLAARIVFAIFIALFIWDYWSAYQHIPGYRAKRMWTAAALSVGLRPFYALGYFMLFLMGEWLVRVALKRRRYAGRD